MPAPTPPALIVFDVGNVLVNWDPDQVYADLLPDPADRAAFAARVGLDAMNLAGDAGRLADAVAANIAAHPQDAALIEAWLARWDEMFTPPVPGAFALKTRLREMGLRVFGLTNFAADTWERACRLYPDLTGFDDVIVSGQEGVLKPDAGIYEILETRAGLTGEALFFIDDRPANIEAARARGWRGHVFTGMDGLLEALRAEGLTL